MALHSVDATAAFFEGLAAGEQVPDLAKATGSLRFDIADGGRAEHWYVDIDHGTVTVHRKDAAADLVLRMERDVFEAILAGRTNGMAAALRGAVRGEGDLGLLVLFQRLFGQPTSRAYAGAPSQAGGAPRS